LRPAALARIDVAPSAENGLRVSSQIAVDRPNTVRLTKLGPIVGRLENEVMLEVNRTLAVFFGLA
jgi:mRNA interferase MazF